MRYSGTTTEQYPVIMEIDQIADWLRVSGDNPGVNIAFNAALGYAEAFCNQPLFARSYTLTLPDFYRSGRLNGINPAELAVKYNAAGVTNQVLDITGYGFLDGTFRFIQDSVLSLSPTSVTLTYTVGWTAETVPPNVILALLMLANTAYDNRGNWTSEKVTAAEKWLQPYKVEPV